MDLNLPQIKQKTGKRTLQGGLKRAFPVHIKPVHGLGVECNGLKTDGNLLRGSEIPAAWIKLLLSQASKLWLLYY
jgi:hypothetical protein